MPSKQRVFPPEINSVEHLRELQRVMAGALFRPLTQDERMQGRWVDGTSMSTVVDEFIKPNGQLTSFERLEIYNRQYWFRLLGSLQEDYPGLMAVLGERRFLRLARAYLVRYPSASFTLRNLGSRLESFLLEEPQDGGPHPELALDMALFEWAQVVAFDGAARPVVDLDDLLGSDPARLRLGLQPYLSFLELNYPVDDFVLEVKKGDSSRSAASNAVGEPHRKARRRKLALPAPAKTYVAVQRYDTALYYKRLEPEAYHMLIALREGAFLEAACEPVLNSDRQLDWPSLIKDWFQTWSSLGWFCRWEELSRDRPEAA